MQLKFLGQSYTIEKHQIPTVASKHTACYRGQKYYLRNRAIASPIISQASQTSVIIRKYRGVSYIAQCNHLPQPKKKEVCHS